MLGCILIMWTMWHDPYKRRKRRQTLFRHGDVKKKKTSVCRPRCIFALWQLQFNFSKRERFFSCKSYFSCSSIMRSLDIIWWVKSFPSFAIDLWHWNATRGIQPNAFHETFFSWMVLLNSNWKRHFHRFVWIFSLIFFISYEFSWWKPIHFSSTVRYIFDYFPNYLSHRNSRELFAQTHSKWLIIEWRLFFCVCVCVFAKLHSRWLVSVGHKCLVWGEMSAETSYYVLNDFSCSEKPNGKRAFYIAPSSADSFKDMY